MSPCNGFRTSFKEARSVALGALQPARGTSSQPVCGSHEPERLGGRDGGGVFCPSLSLVPPIGWCTPGESSPLMSLAQCPAHSHTVASPLSLEVSGVQAGVCGSEERRGTGVGGGWRQGGWSAHKAGVWAGRRRARCPAPGKCWNSRAGAHRGQGSQKALVSHRFLVRP